MHAGAVTCRPDTPVSDVARTMQAEHISALVVIDAAGLAVGVISKTDLANSTFVEAYLAHWRGMEARHLMTSPAVSVRPETPIAEAIELLRRRKIHRLVVTEPAAGGERPVGILSMTDIVARMEVPHHG
jgi:CBS domain-containing protein